MFCETTPGWGAPSPRFEAHVNVDVLPSWKASYGGIAFPKRALLWREELSTH